MAYCGYLSVSEGDEEPPDTGDPTPPSEGFDPSLVSLSCSVRNSNPSPGERARVDVTYENGNSVTGEAEVEVIIDGEVIDTRQTPVSPGTYQRSIPIVFEDSGDYRVQLRIANVTRY